MTITVRLVSNKEKPIEAASQITRYVSAAGTLLKNLFYAISDGIAIR